MAIPIHDLWWLAARRSAGYGARFMKARIDAPLTARRRSRLPDPTGELLRLQTLYGYNPNSLASVRYRTDAPPTNRFNGENFGKGFSGGNDSSRKFI